MRPARRAEKPKRRPLLPRVACLLGWGLTGLLVMLGISWSCNEEHRAHDGRTMFIGGWFYGFPRGTPGVEADFAKAFRAFEAYVLARGFAKTSLVAVRGQHPSHDDTIHTYVGHVGEDEVAVQARELSGEPIVGVEIYVAYDVDGYDSDVPGRVASIRQVGEEIAAWADAHEAKNPVFDEERQKQSDR